MTADTDASVCRERMAPSRFRDAATAITAAMLADPLTYDRLVDLLIAAGKLPSAADDEDPVFDPVIARALERFSDIVAPILETALSDIVEEDGEHLSAIRRFFLEPRNAYSIDDLAALWRISAADVREIYSDALVQQRDSNGESFRIPWQEAWETAVTFGLLRPFDVERALADEFTGTLPEAWRTVPVTVRVPKFVADALPQQALMSSHVALATRIEHLVLDLFSSTRRVPLPVCRAE